jgi:tight adherence protein C
MANIPIIYTVLAVLLFLAGPILFLVAMVWLRTGNLQQRMDDYVIESAPKPNMLNRLRSQTYDLTGSFFSRVVIPWVKKVGKFFGRYTPTGTIQRLNHDLTVAGNPFGMEAREFFGISMASLAIGAFLSILIAALKLSGTSGLLAIVPVFAGFLLPRFWLQTKVRKRQDAIRKGLPDALDMLSVCASAGLGFDQSLQRVSEHWKTAIGLEFGRLISEIEMGVQRRDALRNMANRLDVQELSSFVAFMIQSEQLGMSVLEVLHAQADQMRVERRFRAQEQAQKIPTKMIFPMALFIFPALLAIIMGPIVPQLLNFLENFG